MCGLALIIIVKPVRFYYCCTVLVEGYRNVHLWGKDLSLESLFLFFYFSSNSIIFVRYLSWGARYLRGVVGGWCVSLKGFKSAVRLGVCALVFFSVGSDGILYSIAES